MPILDLQKRVRQIGSLRLGEMAETRKGKMAPRSRETWKVTCTTQEIAAAVAALYGGTPEPFEHEREPWAVETTTDRLPIAVVPGHAISQFYELWSGGGCQRRCDGVDELISSGPCLCDPDERACKPYTRLSVVVRGIDALGLFRLNTSGWYAATELAGAVEFLEGATASGEILPGWLRIEERRQISNGQTKIFKVPVLDVAFGIDRMIDRGNSSRMAVSSASGLREIGDGTEPTPIDSYETVPDRGGVDVETGLAAAERQREPRARTARSQAEFGPDGDFEDGQLFVAAEEVADAINTAAQVAPVQVVETDMLDINGDPITFEAPVLEEEKKDDSPQKLLTKPQSNKLDVLVGKLRGGGHLTTEQLYTKIARVRNIPVDVMVELIEGSRDEEGILHWAPLRDGLFRPEATELIESLTKYGTQIAAREE